MKVIIGIFPLVLFGQSLPTNTPTGSGSLVLATSPTLTTPVLGTPSTLVLTNATGLPVPGGGTGLATITTNALIKGAGTGAMVVSGVLIDSSNNVSTPGTITSGTGSGVAGVLDLTQGTLPGSFPANSFSLYAPTSIATSYQWILPAADSAGAIVSSGAGTPGVLSIVGFSGTGNIARVTSPTFVTPALGTPASGNASNLTNLPITLTTTGSSGAATWTQGTNTLNIPQYSGGGGANTALSNLASVSINTSLLFQSGQAVGSTTNPASNIVMNLSGTYGTGSYTFAGTPTANRTITMPVDANFTVARQDAAQTFTGVQTMTSPVFSTKYTSPMWIPASDSTTAIQIDKADGSTNIVTVDTTNGRLGVGVTPAQLVHFEKNQNAATQVLVENTTAGGASQADYEAKNDGGHLFQFGVVSTTYSTYGALVADNAFFYTDRDFTMMADSGGTIKIAAKGNTERMRIQQGVSIGNTTDPGANNLSVTGTIATASHLISTGTTPGISGCGSGAALDANATDEGGSLTLGTAAGTCVITFATTYTTNPKCAVTFEGGVLGSYSHSATAITITATGLTGGVDYRCSK